MSTALEQKRYLDMMATSAFTAIIYSRDPIGIIRSTLEAALEDQSKASALAASRKASGATREWLERQGMKAILSARPAFQAAAGTIVLGTAVSPREGTDLDEADGDEEGLFARGVDAL